MSSNKRRPPKGIPNLSEIYSLLYRIGITPNYTGFFYVAYAIYLAAQQPERLLLVTKLLYPEVAKQYGTTWKCVERNIRTVLNIAWNTNSRMLERLAQHPLVNKPKSSQLLAILALYFSPERAA